MERRYELEYGATNQHAPSYVCSLTEFEQTTNAPDGSNLEVVDESIHKVVGYYMAFNGYWNER